MTSSIPHSMTNSRRSSSRWTSKEIRGKRRHADKPLTGRMGRMGCLSKASALAKIDIHTRKVTEYPFPYRYAFPYALAVDKNHMVWVGALDTNSIFKFNPSTGKFTEYPLPSVGTDIRLLQWMIVLTLPPSGWLTGRRARSRGFSSGALLAISQLLAPVISTTLPGFVGPGRAYLAITEAKFPGTPKPHRLLNTCGPKRTRVRHSGGRNSPGETARVEINRRRIPC